MDCEVMRSNIGQVLGRVSVISYKSETISDAFVYYPELILSHTPTENIPQSLGMSPIRVTALNLFLKFRLFSGTPPNRIVIVHDIQKHLKVVSIDLTTRHRMASQPSNVKALLLPANGSGVRLVRRQ